MEEKEYTTKQHSSIVKDIGQMMDKMEKDKEKELVFNLLIPIRKMNEHIHDMTNNFEEFTKNKESSSILNELHRFNTRIIAILCGKQIVDENNNNNSDINNNHNNNNNNKSNAMAMGVDLYDLIIILIESDEYPNTNRPPNKERLRQLLEIQNINSSNVLSRRNDLISLLEDCGLYNYKAKAIFSNIESNFGVSSSSQNNSHSQQQSQSQSQSQTQSNQKNETVSNGHVQQQQNGSAGTTDDSGVNVVDLALMAIEGVYTDRSFDRRAIERLFVNNNIDTIKVLSMTENSFAQLLNQYDGYGQGFAKYQSIKIHRAIKQFLNAPQTQRLDINITAAVMYLCGKDLFSGKSLEIDEEVIKQQFNKYDAKQVLDMGKKKFIGILAKQCDIKMGHGTKIWNNIKTFIEDENMQIPPEIILKKDENENEDEDENQDENNNDNNDSNEKNDKQSNAN